MSRRRTLGRLAAMTALVAGSLGLAPQSVGGQAAPGVCPSPYAPVAFAETYPAQEALPSVDATEVAIRRLPDSPAFDSDGDGIDDTVSSAGDTVTITRGDGVVTLQAPGATSIIVYGVGDVDGDGRDEFAVLPDDSATDPGTYLIPGTVPVGATTTTAAGIVFQPGGLGLVHVDDGSDRLLRINLDPGETAVLDGPTVLALGAGGDGDSVAATDVHPFAALALADTGEAEATLVLGEQVGGEVALTIIRGGEVIHLTTAPEPFFPGGSSPVGELAILIGPDGTFVRLTQSSRSGAGAYLWSLTDPCTTLAADVVPTAPPAAPVETEARFTG